MSCKRFERRNTMNNSEEVIFTKEMCERLSITSGTLRKWCLELEENGYTFQKSDSGKRFFSVYDETALHRMKHLMDQNFSKEHAAKVVTSKMNGSRSSTGTPGELAKIEQSNNVPVATDVSALTKLTESLMERFEDQERQNTLLHKTLEEIQERNKEDKERLEKKIDELQKQLLNDSRERDKKLLEGIRQLQDQKQELLQLAAAQEEENKKGFFARLFNR
jgi:DNA-binding transcriptional MerR regulator